MDDKVAFTNEGLQSFYATFVLGCAQWKQGTQLEELNAAAKRLQSQGALK